MNHSAQQLITRVLAIPTKWYLVAVIALGGILRFAGIGTASIWHDEGYSMMLQADGIGEIIQRTARDVHPPLYYIILHGWSAVFGTSEIAARGLSTVFALATIAVIYVIMRRLFSEGSARLAALFVATGPFVIRYSQEARMYSMVAFLVTASTYLLVRAMETKSWRSWTGYGAVIAAALYTHYYAVFIIPVHIGYAVWKSGGVSRLIRNSRWWAANLLGAGLFALWLPSAYAQFSRVQGGFWIPEPTALTLPNSLAQLMTFTDMSPLPAWTRILTTCVAVAAVIWVLVRWRHYRRASVLLAAWATFPAVAVVLVSLARPVYVDRYFVFSAVAAYALMGAMIACSSWLRRRPAVAVAAIVLVLATFGFGRFEVANQSGHRMRVVGEYVNQNYQPGDALVSGELYTYFDFSYYNKTGAELQVLSENPVNGYGETSLFYERANEVVVSRLSDVRAASGRVWVVGKTGQHDYFNNVPSTWRQIGDPLEAGYSAVRLYQVDANPIAAVQ